MGKKSASAPVTISAMIVEKRRSKRFKCFLFRDWRGKRSVDLKSLVLCYCCELSDLASFCQRKCFTFVIFETTFAYLPRDHGKLLTAPKRASISALLQIFLL